MHEIILLDRCARQLMPAYPLSIPKFGSSVLVREADYSKVALEIYRHVREGERVIAIVSVAGRTDDLLAEARRLGGDAAPDALVARLARIGELQSSALLALALGNVGLLALALDPYEIGLTAEGEPLDSVLTDLDRDAVFAHLAACDVLVVAGFFGVHAESGKRIDARNISLARVRDAAQRQPPSVPTTWTQDGQSSLARGVAERMKVELRA